MYYNHFLCNGNVFIFRKTVYSDSIICFLQAYLREGVALQNLGQHGEALVAFASGLAQDPKNGHLLTGLIDTVVKSPLKGKYLY